jgi:Putative binding domain, N-terminal
VSLTSGGGTGAITVTATAGYPWSSTSGATWLTITSGASGMGPGSVPFSAAATSSARSANLTIAGQSVTVTQGAVPAPPSNVHILTTP